MSRVYKFRAWGKKEKKMHNENNVAVLGNTPLLYSTHNFETLFYSLLERKDLVLMQYTGLKDKNGKLIYESDLLKDSQGDIREIVFEEGGFWLKYPNGNHYMLVESMREVMGNDYEHPLITR